MSTQNSKKKRRTGSSFNNSRSSIDKQVGRHGAPYLLSILLIVVILGVSWGYYKLKTAHLFGEELVISNENFSLPTITLATNPQTTTRKLIDSFETPTPNITPAPHLCNSDQAVMYFLFIAKDYEEDNNEHVSPESYQVGFADAIRIVKVDFRDATITSVSIPRDLIVAVPGLQAKGIYEAKLKMIYAYGNEYDLPGGGASLLAQSLITNFGFQIDHYVILNFWSFVLGIESIGGIDIEIPKNVGHYSAGTKHMNGWQALDYARLRDQAGEDTSDATRRERQTQVLFAIQKKVFSTEIIPKIPEVVTHLIQAIQTDLTSDQISLCLCLAEQVKAFENIELSPNFYLQEVDAFGKEQLIPDYIAIREFVEEFQSQ